MSVGLLWLVSACVPPDSSPTTDADDRTEPTTEAPLDTVDTGGDPEPVPVAEPTHDAHLAPVWDQLCRGCHTPAFPFAGLVFPDAYDLLVGVPSEQVPTMARVEPGDLDNSYLLHKLQGTHRSVGGKGDRMPSARPELTEVEMGNLVRWIEQGAPR
ncbi:MAG: hypothetical protein KTR31_28720 [Myxococcales bacterium]|nr:hypothetical protein [Myxococcales bacterium]